MEPRCSRTTISPGGARTRSGSRHRTCVFKVLFTEIEVGLVGCEHRGHSGLFGRRGECRSIVPDELLHAQRRSPSTCIHPASATEPFNARSNTSEIQPIFAVSRRPLHRAMELSVNNAGTGAGFRVHWSHYGGSSTPRFHSRLQLAIETDSAVAPHRVPARSARRSCEWQREPEF